MHLYICIYHFVNIIANISGDMACNYFEIINLWCGAYSLISMCGGCREFNSLLAQSCLPLEV